jgi:predicted permease
MQTLLQDIRYALRQMRKSPGFTLTAVLTLALGIGATTTVFSIVNSVLLKPFPFRDSKRLVTLREAARGRTGMGPDNFQHYLNWKKNAKTLDGAAIFFQDGFSVASGSGHPQILRGLRISPNYFSVLDVRPALGRSFLPVEASAGHNNVVILSWGAWQQYFHGDRNAVGKTLRVGGVPKTVVGILPRGIRFPHLSAMEASGSHINRQPYAIFEPLLPDPSDFGDRNRTVIARLRPGVTVAQAQSEVTTLEQEYFRSRGRPDAANVWVQAQPLLREATANVSTGLWLSLAAAGVVLLIGCINLASLQLARSVTRDREMAVRAALGAGRSQLLWVTLRENLLLALAGGGLGVAASILGVHLFVSTAPASLPRLSAVHVSWPVLVAALGLSIATALLFGLLPAMRSLRIDPQSVIQANTQRAANTRDGRRARNLLVAGEVACTLALLMLSGLLLQSLSKVLTQQRNFDASHLTLVRVDLDTPRYGKDAVRAHFMDQSMSRLRHIPGVQSVALTSATPLTGNTWEDSMVRPDHPVPVGQQPLADMRWVSPSYASTLHIPLLEGRDLQPSDRNQPAKVLISEQTAHSVWPGTDPVGRTFQAGGETYTVVGVVANARINSLKSTTNMVYVPYWDNPSWSAVYLVRSTLPASSMAHAIRSAIWKIDPEVPIPVLKSMHAQVSDSLSMEYFQTWLLAGFGGTALLLAMLGIYGTLAYSVSLRRQEFGIRMALGCKRSELMQFVLRHAFVPIFAGVVAGMGIGRVATRWLSSMLYDTSPANPGVIVACAGVLLATALLATLLPARRAARVEPMEALRNE